MNEEIPEKFKELWGKHEQECSESKCSKCAELTIRDIEEARGQFSDEDYKRFLEMRLTMFRGLVHADPCGDSRIYWYQSMAYLDTALKELAKQQKIVQEAL